MWYDEKVKKIPAAAITVEDAILLQNLQDIQVVCYSSYLLF